MREPRQPDHRTSVSEPNVTPMLDVLLVLIIIFMWVVMKSSGKIEAQLPEECRAACESGTSIVLEVLPGRVYRLNRMPIPAESLVVRLREAYSGRPEKVLQVAGSRDATYQEVVSAMDVARSAGVLAIGLPRTNLPSSKE